MLKVGVNISGIEARLNKLSKSAQKAVRPAAQAGTQILYEAVLQEVPQSSSGHWFHGRNEKYWFDAGSLRDSIYQVFSEDQSTQQKATYEISFNHTKAPYGFMVLRGTSRAAANDFIGRAHDLASAKAKAEVRKQLKERIKGDADGT